MLNNKNLFKFSLNHLEPLIDDFYSKDAKLIITNSSNYLNKLMEVNSNLIKNITAYEISKSNKNEEMQSRIIESIKKLLNNEEINYSEFVSFWAVLDVSYSAYKALDNNNQTLFIKHALEKFIELRHNLYLAHGYTPTTLQVSKDAKSHKSSASLGINKCAYTLNKFNYEKLSRIDYQNFSSSKKLFILIDKKGKKLFNEIVKKNNIKLKWTINHEGKIPDILFKNDKNIYIVEHKHMKESGGGQDKQINEIIDFISYSENNSKIRVHYVSFLDGSYFNLFSKTVNGSINKLKNQIDKINISLSNNPNNYFVNTAGFYKLLELI